MSGAGNNKMVAGVSFFFSSGGSPILFTPSINPSQPTNRSSFLCSRYQNMCRVAHEGVKFIVQSELALPMVPLFTEFLREYNCAAMCYLIHVCLLQAGAIQQDKWKAACSKMKEAIPVSSPLRQLLHQGLIHEKCHVSIFS